MIIYMSAEEARTKSQEVAERNSPLNKLMEIIFFNINQACVKGDFECTVVYHVNSYAKVIEKAMHNLRMAGYAVEKVTDGIIEISW